MPVERVGIEGAPLGGPAATVPSKRYEMPHRRWFVTVVLIMAI